MFEDYQINGKDLNDIIVPMAFNEEMLRRVHLRSHKHISEYPFYYPNGLCIPGIQSLFVRCDGSFKFCEKADDDVTIGNIHDGFNYELIEELVSKYCQLGVKDCVDCWAFRC
jgi:uncharacterized protein